MFGRCRCDDAGAELSSILHLQGGDLGNSRLCQPRRSCAEFPVPGERSIPGSLSVCPLSIASCQGWGPPCDPSFSPQVLSGCAIIVRGQPRGGPPPERQINLSNIRAGNLARRAGAGQPDAKDTPDEVGTPGAVPRSPLPRGSRGEQDGGVQATGPALQPLQSRLGHCKRHRPFPTCCCRPGGRRRLLPRQRCPAQGHGGAAGAGGKTVPSIVL